MSEHKNKRVPVELPEEKVVQREDVDLSKTPKVETRRVRIYLVRPAEFMMLFTKGLKFRKNFAIVKGLPEDAKLVSMAYDNVRNGVFMVVQSASFDPIPVNVVPPADFIDIDFDGVDKPTKKTGSKRRK